MKSNFYISLNKRIFDLFFALLLSILFLPLIILIIILVRFKLGSPVFFKQNRPGLHGKPFVLFKFRTMVTEYDGTGKLLPDEDRITHFGLFLRSTSLDELPTIFNVIKGEMSIVGPRPLLMEYLPLYNPEQSRRHEVRPGITGWAQVNGRNAITWEEKFKLDIWYIKHLSLWLDLRILVLTILKVLKREGINQTEHSTMERFMGNK